MKLHLKPRVVHGTPITPAHLLNELRGESFCVSFFCPRQLEQVLPLQDKNGILVLDNGAFSIWKQAQGAKQIDRDAFWKWANEVQARCQQAVAVIPDVITGTEEQNWIEASYAVRYGMSKFPERTMFIWHMNDSIDNLARACRLFNFIGIGSCAEYDVQKNPAGYRKRLSEAARVVRGVELVHGRRPWVHLMRGLGVLSQALWAQSADSTNVARNHCRTKGKVDEHVKKMSNRIRAAVAKAAAKAPLADAVPTSNFA